MKTKEEEKALASYHYTDIIRDTLDKYLPEVAYSGKIVLELEDFISETVSQTRQADVEGLIEWIESDELLQPPLSSIFSDFEAGYVSAMQTVVNHLKQLKENI